MKWSRMLAAITVAAVCVLAATPPPLHASAHGKTPPATYVPAYDRLAVFGCGVADPVALAAPNPIPRDAVIVCSVDTPAAVAPDVVIRDGVSPDRPRVVWSTPDFVMHATNKASTVSTAAEYHLLR